MERIRRAYRTLCRWEEHLAQILLGLTVVVVLVGAIARFAAVPLPWSMEVATFLFAWAAFFSADVALRENRHVSVDFFVDRLPAKARAAIKLVDYLLIMAFLLFLIGYGIEMTYRTRFRAFQGIPGFSYLWVTLSVPVGSFLLLLTTLQKIGEMAGRLRRPASRTTADTEPAGVGASPGREVGGSQA